MFSHKATPVNNKFKIKINEKSSESLPFSFRNTSDLEPGGLSQTNLCLFTILPMQYKLNC